MVKGVVVVFACSLLIWCKIFEYMEFNEASYQMIELNVWKFEKDGVQFLNRLYIFNNDILNV